MSDNANTKLPLDEQAERTQRLAEDINPSQDKLPDSAAEATTAPLKENDLGGSATQDTGENH